MKTKMGLATEKIQRFITAGRRFRMRLRVNDAETRSLIKSKYLKVSKLQALLSSVIIRDRNICF